MSAASICTFSWRFFKGKQKLNAINSIIPSAPRFMTFYISDMKSPCLCKWGDYRNPACILKWYFCSWHCNCQCSTKYYTLSDIPLITLDAIWKLKPIRFIIRRQLHDTVAGEIRIGGFSFHENIQLYHETEDTRDIGLLLIPWSTLNYKKKIILVFRAKKGCVKWSKAEPPNEIWTGLVIGCLHELYSVTSLFQLSKAVLITSNRRTSPAKQIQ